MEKHRRYYTKWLQEQRKAPQVRNQVVLSLQKLDKIKPKIIESYFIDDNLNNLIQQQFRGGTTHPHGKGWFLKTTMVTTLRFAFGNKGDKNILPRSKKTPCLSVRSVGDIDTQLL